MNVQLWKRISITVLFAILCMILLSTRVVEASNPPGPIPPTPPIQGCNSATGLGASFKTCAFYVVASNIAQTSNDAGMKPECLYTISAREIYFGRCNSGTTPISSGFRFQNVSIPIPTGQTILSSYVEFTVDGTYTNKIVKYLWPNTKPHSCSIFRYQFRRCYKPYYRSADNTVDNRISR